MKRGLTLLAALVIGGGLGWTNAHRAAADDAPATQPFSLHNRGPRLSPFTAVRWHPEVQYQGKWYELIAINDVPAADILNYLKQSKDSAAEKHFAEDMVEVMTQMGHEPGDTVKLRLKILDTNESVTISDAAMTAANRRSVLVDGNPK